MVTAGLCTGSEWYTSSQGQARLFYRRKAELWEGDGVGRVVEIERKESRENKELYGWG